ncbi:hypothetical protein J2795_001675 [Chryseobacterium bernardetii]|uniref:Uncharacterized protein n=2 Tax=Chryseobacterium TaxID=59732 RepID=A0A543EIG3_9FLAO|nr:MULTISPECIES: hypothetical protein [Chryseobacterium]MDR6369782.1 hypothetical protein [Chryseobacterium vietnamense]MDR6440975.1 hypothetical protein [Chryseobacterium bernardetii]TQM21345.1 hypothetical protein FB551_1031 [Chryseobacterium aquifrigidense]
MSISNFLFGENIPLFQLEKFSQEYTLKVENTFIMGEENKPISLKTSSDIIIEQEKRDHNINTTIKLQEITGDTDDTLMKPFLLQSLALADISRNIQLKRNLSGKILSIENKPDLWKSWEEWKENKLASAFPEEKDQNKLITNYEKGLKNFDVELKKNLQYILLLPEVYNLIFPPNEYYSFLFSLSNIHSRLIDGVEYHYQLKLVKLEEENNNLFVEFHSVLNNHDELMKSHIKKLYEKEEDFSVDEFEFSIKTKYNFEKSTAKILNAELYFVEKMHEHLAYFIDMDLHSK